MYIIITDNGNNNADDDGNNNKCLLFTNLLVAYMLVEIIQIDLSV